MEEKSQDRKKESNLTGLVDTFFLSFGRGPSFSFEDPLTGKLTSSREYFKRIRNYTTIGHQMPYGVKAILQVDERVNDVSIYFSGSTTQGDFTSFLEQLKTKHGYEFTYALEGKTVAVFGTHPTFKTEKIEILRLKQDRRQYLRTLHCVGVYMKQGNKNVPVMTQEAKNILDALSDRHVELFSGEIPHDMRSSPNIFDPSDLEQDI